MNLKLTSLIGIVLSVGSLFVYSTKANANHCRRHSYQHRQQQTQTPIIYVPYQQQQTSRYRSYQRSVIIFQSNHPNNNVQYRNGSNQVTYTNYSNSNNQGYYGNEHPVNH